MMLRLAALALVALTVRAYDGPCAAELQCFVAPLDLPWTVAEMDHEKLINGLEECMEKHGCKEGENEEGGNSRHGSNYWRTYYERALNAMKERGSFEPTECERRAALDAGQNYGQCIERSSTVGEHITNKTKKVAMALYGCGPMKAIRVQQCLVTEKSGLTQEQLTAVQAKAREFADKDKMKAHVCECFGPEKMSDSCTNSMKSAANEVCSCVQPLLEESFTAIRQCHNGTEHAERRAKFDELTEQVKKHTNEMCEHSDEIIDDVMSKMCNLDEMPEVFKKWHSKAVDDAHKH